MSERRVCALFAFPLLRCPTVMIKVADTGMVCSDPVVARKDDIKDFVHVTVDGNISVYKDACLVRGQLESSEFGPGILKSSGYEGRLPVLG